MSSGSTNEEGLDLNSEAVPLGEDVVSVTRVTESTSVTLIFSLDETLTEQVSICEGSNHEGGEAPEAGVSVEGLNLLETFAQGVNVREHGIEGSSTKEREEAASGNLLIMEDSEPDVALTLKVCAYDTQELEDTVEVIEAEETFMTITEVTVEEIQGEKAVELENYEVLNPKGDVLEPMDLDEKPYFPEKNQGLEFMGVERNTVANGVRDSREDGTQELVAQVAETLSNQVITEDTDEQKALVSCALLSTVVQVNYTQVSGSLGPHPDQSPDADVQILGVCGSNDEDQRMVSASPQLASSPLVENQSMEVEVETAAASESCKLDENQFQSQSEPIPSDSNVGILVIDLGSHPCTDVNKKTVEEFLNEDERTEVEDSGAHFTNPSTDGEQKTFDEIFKEDGGTVVKERGDNVTNPQKTVGEVFKEEEGSGVKEMLDGNKNISDYVSRGDEGTKVKEMAGDVTHLGRDGNQRNADKVVWEDERTEVREVRDGVTCVGTDGDLKPVDEVFREDEGMEVEDGKRMVFDDVLKEDERSEVKEMGDDVTHLGSNGHQKDVEEVLKEDEGAEVADREDDVNFSVSDCLDESVPQIIGGVGSLVNQKIETSKEVTTTLRPGTASVNDNHAFYGLTTEKEGEFSVSDLVWGKVKSHPWWPGQIFDPSDASEKAMKYRKKDSFLVAYFGDRTFAWNEASVLKPFRTHFSQMDKQTNLDSSRKAVNCALDEIARRVELGLTCSCTSEEVYAKIGSQRIENAGIRKESSMREGVDKSLSVSSFEPEMLVDYIRALALIPHGRVDRLELVIAQAQLLALCRSRGYSCLPKFQLCGGLVENEADSLILAEINHSKETVHDTAAISENEDRVLSGKGKLKSRDGSSRKRKHTSEDGVRPAKKERSLSELMAGKKFFSSDDGNGSVEGAASKTVSSSSGKKRKAGDSFPDDPVIQNRKRSISLYGAADADSAQPKRSFKVGESICRVASQLTGSLPILKCSSERLRKGAAKEDQSTERTTWVGGDVSPRTPEQRRKMVIPTEHPSPDEILSQLCLAARDPMKGYSFLTTIISFFSEFRNSVCIEHTSSWKHKMSLEKIGGKKKRSPNSNINSTESYAFEDMQDSYWTDRIVQIGLEEQPLDEKRKKRGRPRKKMIMLTNGDDNSHQWSPTLDIVQQNPDDNAEQPVEVPVGSVDANFKDYNSPAALILSFSESDADCIPSEKILSRLFRHFGPLKESETEVLKTTNCARVVFKRRTDAEVALSSAGKFSIFGPMHVSYRLMYLPSTPGKTQSLAAAQGTEDMAPLGTVDMAQQFIEYMASEGMEDMAPQGTVDMAQQFREYMASEGMKDMAPEGTEDMAPQYIEYMEPEGSEDMAPEGTEDMAPEGTEDMAPQYIEYMASEGMEDMAPEGTEDLAPQHTEDMAPEGTEDMTPQQIEDVASQGIENMARQGTEDMAPVGTKDVGPQHTEDMAPGSTEDMTAQQIEDVAAHDIEDMAREGTEDLAPQHIEDVAQQGIEDMAPQLTEDVAPQDIEDVGQPGIEAVAPEGTEDMAPQHIEDVAPQDVEDMALQGIEDITPAGGNTS